MSTPYREQPTSTREAAGADPYESSPASSDAGGHEDLLRLLVAGVRDYAIFMLDRNGNVATWNSGAEQINGFSAGDILGRSCAVFYPDDSIRRGRPRQDLELAESAGRFEDDGWRLRADGSRFWANVVITPVRDQEGRLRGFATVVQDLSERKQAEDRLRHSNELLEARVQQRTRELEAANAALRAEIEERKRAEAALRESEARHRSVLDLMPVAVYLCGADGTLQYFNRLAAHLWGRTPELNAAHQRFSGASSLAEPDGTPLPFDHTPMAQVLEGAPPIRNRKLMIHRPDGSEIIARMNIDPVYDESGALAGAISVFQDVTDVERLFDQVAASEERYRHLIHALPAAVYTTDARGRITLFNEHAVELWGRRPEVGKDLWCGSWRIYRSDGSPLAHDDCPMAVSLREGRGVRGQEILVERPDGRRIPVLPHPQPLRDANGEIVGGVNMLVDLTELKRSQETSRRQAEELAKLMDVLPVAVWIAQDAACTEIIGNSAGERLLRMPVGSNLSMSAPAGEPPIGFKVLRHGRELRADELPMQYAARHGVIVSDFEEEIVFDDGQHLYAYGSASPLFDSDGEVRGCVGAFMDVSELKRLDRELRAKMEELATADRLKDEFLAILAHELRNPLAPICTGLELLRLAPDNAQLLQETRESMNRQAQHLVRLVDDLLDVSRISRGKLELRKERLDLRTVADTSVSALRPLMANHGHQLNVRLPERPLMVYADATRLAQVIGNLLNNAIKFTREPGQVELLVDRDGSEITIAVRDSGIGISSDEIEAVFDMFFQARDAQQAGTGGLGIGLTLVKRLVEMHDGRVEVTSEGCGRGSTFTVRLPASTALRDDQQPQPGDAELEPAPARAPRRVLIVDDNVDTAMALKRLLEIEGDEVECAFDGAHAIEAAENVRPEVILMDIGMPRMNGLDAARIIRQRPWGANVLIIAATGWGKDADRERSLQAGFDHHLVKPVDPAKLRRLLAAAQPRNPDTAN